MPPASLLGHGPPLATPLSKPSSRMLGAGSGGGGSTMRDRAKNRKPMQRGRYLSVEGIQAVQALKRAKISREDAGHVLESRVRRLVKADMVAVLRELQSQGEALLALQVFEEVRKEHWYKPKLSVYVDMISVLASKGLKDELAHVCSSLKMERWEADTEGFNLLLKTLMEFGYIHIAMDCFRLMKLWESDPDEFTYTILIRGMESKGEMDLSAALRQEAQKYFGETFELVDMEQIV